MGKKKRNHPDVEEVLARPWCYYCERDFDDLKILISHQKAKHFKCERCGRRLNTAGGLSVHMNQVHKETLTSVDNALPSRIGLDVEIFGMEGIPEEVVAAHNHRVLQQFYEAEAARQQATGNPAPGSKNQGPGVKKPKTEATSDLKARLAEHRAKKAREAAEGGSGSSTPMGQSPAISQPPSASAFSPASTSPYPPQGQPTYSAPGASPAAGYAPYGQPPYQQPYVSPGGQFSPPNGGFPPPASHYPPGGASYQAPYQAAPPVPYGAAAPGGYAAQAPPGQLPPSNGSLPPRPTTISPAPGLPQRPSFGTPPIDAQQMQQMHPGQMNAHAGANGSAGAAQESSYATSIDELISSAARDADSAAAANTPRAETSEKKSKKAKEKATIKLVYSDDEVSPEEKMAQLPRYHVEPGRTPTTTA